MPVTHHRDTEALRRDALAAVMTTAEDWQALMWTAATHPHYTDALTLAMAAHQAPYDVLATEAEWARRGLRIREDAEPCVLRIPAAESPAHNGGHRPALTTEPVYARSRTTPSDPGVIPGYTQVIYDPAYDSSVRTAACDQLAAEGGTIPQGTDARTALGALALHSYRLRFAAAGPAARAESESAAHLAALILHTRPGEAPHPRMSPEPGDRDPYAVTLATITRVVHTGRQIAERLDEAMF